MLRDVLPMLLVIIIVLFLATATGMYVTEIYPDETFNNNHVCNCEGTVFENVKKIDYKASSWDYFFKNENGDTIGVIRGSRFTTVTCKEIK